MRPPRNDGEASKPRRETREGSLEAALQSRTQAAEAVVQKFGQRAAEAQMLLQCEARSQVACGCVALRFSEGRALCKMAPVVELT